MGVRKEDFFGYATVARVVGFEGTSSGGLSLLIEGTGRVKMGSLTKEAPYYEVQVEQMLDDGEFRQLLLSNRDLA